MAEKRELHQVGPLYDQRAMLDAYIYAGELANVATVLGLEFEVGSDAWANWRRYKHMHPTSIDGIWRAIDQGTERWNTKHKLTIPDQDRLVTDKQEVLKGYVSTVFGQAGVSTVTKTTTGLTRLAQHSGGGIVTCPVGKTRAEYVAECRTTVMLGIEQWADQGLVEDNFSYDDVTREATFQIADPKDFYTQFISHWRMGINGLHGIDIMAHMQEYLRNTATGLTEQ